MLCLVYVLQVYCRTNVIIFGDNSEYKHMDISQLLLWHKYSCSHQTLPNLIYQSTAWLITLKSYASPPVFVTRTHILQSGLTLRWNRGREPVLKSGIMGDLRMRGMPDQVGHDGKGARYVLKCLISKKTVANITHFSQKISVLCFSIYKPHSSSPQRNYVYL